MDENLQLPETGDPDAITALTAELESLRSEKRRRRLLDTARDHLRQRGLDAGFAALLAGEDDKQTVRNIGEFEKQFTAALAAEMARRLPRPAPADFEPSGPPPKAARRGIRKL